MPEQAVGIRLFGKAIKPVAFMLLALVVFFGSLLALDRMLYQVSIPSIEAVQAGEVKMKPADLRGSMTIADGAAHLGMDVPDGTRLNAVKAYAPEYDFHAVKARK